MDPRKENLEFHARSLNLSFPDAECSIVGQTLIWRGKLTPDYFCRTYDVEIEYKAFERPIVRVSPIGMEIPVRKLDIHMYEDGSLCLYNNDNKEWNSNIALAKSIIPWICEWLYFYEIWLVTRKWCG
jgi:hypothetical protein